MKFKNNVKPNVKISLSSDVGFLGPGVCRLLQIIDQTGSIQQACEEMNISYSKARKMINKLEAECDFPVVERKAGGIHGGSTTLSDQGKELISRYLELEKEMKSQVETLYKKYFGE